MWTALAPISVDMGPMVHLSGSHREPPAGIFGYGGEDAQGVYPEIFKKHQVSQPRAYNPGDAVFHHCLTWHHAGINKTDKLRWAITNQRMSSNVRYTGQPSGNTDGMRLVFNKTFDHPNFLTVYP
jgi:ectoine hydroxylase-related dioxygenase (phytanoyl-CoA dioxygenase family)